MSTAEVNAPESDTFYAGVNEVLYLKNITKSYLLGEEGISVLKGVSLIVEAGEFLAIYGHSGCGKTTLFNIISTMDKPTNGELRICETEVGPKTKDNILSDLRMDKIGIVFQNSNLLKNLTIFENVEIPMIVAGKLNKSQRHEKVMELLKTVGLSKYSKYKPGQLSIGQQQRISIIRAVANDPKLLILDEPTGSLDQFSTYTVMKMLLDLKVQLNMALVMITHDVNLKDYADKSVFMRDGKFIRLECIEHSKKQNRQQLEIKLKDYKHQKKTLKSAWRTPRYYPFHPQYEPSEEDPLVLEEIAPTESAYMIVESLNRGAT